MNISQGGRWEEYPSYFINKVVDISVKQGNGIIPFKGNVIFLKHANLSYTKRKRFEQK